MAGLNYGNSFKAKRWAYSEGVFFMREINKWITRVRVGKSKSFSTISKHDTEEKAVSAYNEYYNINK